MMKRELYAKNYGQNCSSNEEGGWQLQSIEAFIALGKAVADLMEADIEIVEGEIAIRVCIHMKNRMLSKETKKSFAALVSMSDSMFISERIRENAIAYMEFSLKKTEDTN